MSAKLIISTTSSTSFTVTFQYYSSITLGVNEFTFSLVHLKHVPFTIIG